MLAFSLTLKSNEPQRSILSYQIKTVVIDAGHGGHDTGCKGATGALEKNVTLSVALLLGKKINEAYPGIKVIYTRTTDKFLELHERTAVANRNGANLFISIHCNASTSRAPYGTETFVLGLHKSDDNLDVAKRENSVITYEQNYQDNYDGFDPNAPETHIILNLNANANLEQSSLLAKKIQDQYTYSLKRFNRGIKQAGFVVLYRATMPSVLTEIGFLSNYEEEKYLSHQDGQEDISNALFNAFKEYKEALEIGSGKSGSAIKETPKNPPIVEQTPIKPKVEPEIIKETPPPPVKPEIKPVPVNETVIKSPDVLFKIQIAVTSQPLNIKYAPYNSLNNLHVEKAGNIYKYLVGYFTKYDDAAVELKSIKAKGLKDAFIVVYKQGARLTGDEAKKYLP